MDGYVAEIRMFAGNFAPRNYSYCNGALLPIAQNTALFSLIGTTYGGDGRTTTQLPDLRGRTAVGKGRGPGLANINLGQRGGAETDTITTATMPYHTHTVSGHIKANDGATKSESPIGSFVAETAANRFASGGNPDIALANNTITVTVANNGGGQSHDNMPPYLVLNYIICLQGQYPSRS